MLPGSVYFICGYLEGRLGLVVRCTDGDGDGDGGEGKVEMEMEMEMEVRWRWR